MNILSHYKIAENCTNSGGPVNVCVLPLPVCP